MLLEPDFTPEGSPGPGQLDETRSTPFQPGDAECRFSSSLILRGDFSGGSGTTGGGGQTGWGSVAASPCTAGQEPSSWGQKCSVRRPELTALVCFHLYLTSTPAPHPRVPG